MACVSQSHASLPAAPPASHAGLKEGEVAVRWDKNGNGEISKLEFRKEVLAMVPSTAAEVDNLFHEVRPQLSPWRRPREGLDSLVHC